MDLVRNLNIVDVNTLAEYILLNYGPMSHLKLQKLVYYCEAYHLAYFDEPLIREDFQAWVHGPVCRELYNEIKDYSILYSDIAYTGSIEEGNRLLTIINSNQVEVINDVLNNLSTWTALALETSTHDELPWIEARNGIGSAEKCDTIISKKTMMEYYKKEIDLNR